MITNGMSPPPGGVPHLGLVLPLLNFGRIGLLPYSGRSGPYERILTFYGPEEAVRELQHRARYVTNSNFSNPATLKFFIERAMMLSRASQIAHLLWLNECPKDLLPGLLDQTFTRPLFAPALPGRSKTLVVL